MNKKVLAINSSKRKKNTFGILAQIKEQLAGKSVDVEIIHLFDHEIKECTGCEVCIRKGKCPLTDEAESLMQRLVECDGIIIATPVYMNNLSGKLKVFFDRTSRWVHRPELAMIPVLLVVTTAASGVKNTLKYLDNVTLQWGAFPTNKISRTVKTNGLPVQSKEYEEFLKHLYMKKEEYQPKLRQLIQFQVQKVLAEKVLPKDKEYWEANRWLDKIYFTNARINYINKTLAAVFYKFLSSRIRKVEE